MREINGLRLPENSDQYSIGDFNHNYSTLDTTIQQNANLKVYKLGQDGVSSTYTYNFLFTIPEITEMSEGTMVLLKIGQNTTITSTNPTSVSNSLTLQINDLTKYEVYYNGSLVSASNPFNFTSVPLYLFRFCRHAIPNTNPVEYIYRWDLFELPNPNAGDGSSSGTIVVVPHAVGDVTNVSSFVNFNQVTLTWTDPIDYIDHGVTTGQWAGTKIVRKEGSAPENKDDGQTILNNTARNQYASVGFTTSNYTYGQTYYFRFFPYTTEGIYTTGSYISVTITRQTISTVPSQSNTLTYNKSAQSPTWSNYDISKMNIGGTQGATNAGTYYATFTPLTGYQWSDGTTTAKNVAWTIGKASRSLSIYPSGTTTTINLSGDVGTSKSFWIYTNDTDLGDYIYFNGGTPVYPGNTKDASTSYFTAYAYNDTSPGEYVPGDHYAGIIFTSKQPEGTTTIPISISSSTNYYQVSYSLTIKVEHPTDWSSITWANGSDAEIVSMVNAADQGKINLEEYWAVGNTRSVSLSAIAASGTYNGVSWSGMPAISATTIQLVLLEKGSEGGTNYKLKKDTTKYGSTGYPKTTTGAVRQVCSFFVGVKRAFGSTALLKYIDTSSGYEHGWTNLNVRSWCNGGFYSGLPSSINSIFKQFQIWANSYDSNNGDGAVSTWDYFALHSEKEVVGSIVYGFSDESDVQKYFTYYKTTSNRNKGTTSVGWWFRSRANRSNPNSFLYWVDSASDVRYLDGATSSSTGHCLAPFGAI